MNLLIDTEERDSVGENSYGSPNTPYPGGMSGQPLQGAATTPSTGYPAAGQYQPAAPYTPPQPYTPPANYGPPQPYHAPAPYSPQPYTPPQAYAAPQPYPSQYAPYQPPAPTYPAPQPYQSYQPEPTYQPPAFPTPSYPAPSSTPYSPSNYQPYQGPSRGSFDTGSQTATQSQTQTGATRSRAYVPDEPDETQQQPAVFAGQEPSASLPPVAPAATLRPPAPPSDWGTPSTDNWDDEDYGDYDSEPEPAPAPRSQQQPVQQTRQAAAAPAAAVVDKEPPPILRYVAIGLLIIALVVVGTLIILHRPASSQLPPPTSYTTVPITPTDTPSDTPTAEWYRDPSGTITAAATIDWSKLQVGDCLADDVTTLGTSISTLNVVPCTTEHVSEIYAVSSDVANNDDAKKEFCSTQFQPYIGVSYDASKLSVTFMSHSPDGLTANLQCVVFMQGETSTESVKGSQQ